MTEDALGALGSARVIAGISTALRDIIVRGIGAEFGLTDSDVSFSTQHPTPSTHGTSLSLLVYQMRWVNPHGSLRPHSGNADGAWPAPRESESRTNPLAATPEGEPRPPQLELGYMLAAQAEDARVVERLRATLAKLFHAFTTIHVAALPASEARDALAASGNARLRLLAQYPDMDVIRRLWPVDDEREAVKSALYYRVLPVAVPAQGNETLHRVRELIADNRVKFG